MNQITKLVQGEGERKGQRECFFVRVHSNTGLVIRNISVIMTIEK